MKSGFVTIIGKTNAGKSTLLNKILQRKVSIATSKPQTTRNAIQGIYNDEDSQIVFIDTPGILKPHHELDAFMNREALSSLADVDAVIYLIDAFLPFDVATSSEMYSRLATSKAPLFIVFNKIDLASAPHMDELKAKHKEKFPDAKIFEICAKDGFNVDDLVSELKATLKEGDAFYPEGMLSNHPLTFLFAEIIREQLLVNLKHEVPHSAAVKIDEVERRSDTTHILATIVVERKSQKPIVIGKSGAMIRKIGEEARKEIQSILKRKVNLKLFVSVEEDWRNSQRLLKEYGYDE